MNNLKKNYLMMLRFMEMYKRIRKFSLNVSSNFDLNRYRSVKELTKFNNFYEFVGETNVT